MRWHSNGYYVALPTLNYLPASLDKSSGKVTRSSCQVVLAFQSAKRESKAGPLNSPSPSPLNGKYQDIKSLLVAFK